MSNEQIEVLAPDGALIKVFRPRPPRESFSRLLLHGVLFAATLATTTIVGGLSFASPAWLDAPSAGTHASGLWLVWRIVTDPKVLSTGLQFSLPLLAILLAHEMGHYLACRRHNLDATLPFFIPVPFGIGTMGAFIRIRSPLLTKRELVDMGASGPIAGFLVSLPVLVWGVLRSQVVNELPKGGYLVFGEPILFKLISRLVHPQLSAGADLLLHPMAYAAWVGLLVTALNLLPFGQLDGGHITYAALGRVHRLVAWPLLLVLVALGFGWTGWWVWAIVALVMGVRHPWVPGEDDPFPEDRRWVVVVSWLIFVLSFTPEPIKVVP